MKNFFNEFKKYFYTAHFHGGRRHSDGDFKYYLRRSWHMAPSCLSEIDIRAIRCPFCTSELDK